MILKFLLISVFTINMSSIGFAVIINSTSTKRPNIILFISDDQDIELGSMDYMPKTRHIFGQNGANFVNGFVTTPICCPSRSSLLTGVYVHNHNVHSNNENCSGPFWQSHFEQKTFSTFLYNAGYKTGYFGKYLNEYNGSYVAPGWNYWLGLVKNSRFYNYTVNVNGEKVRHGFDYGRDYFTDLIVNDSLTFLKLEPIDTPKLIVLSFPAPHGPEDPAPQYSHLFENVTTHRTPSWNYAPNPDKQWILQHTGKMEPVHVAFTDFLQRRRLQTLQSIDDAVEKVYNELEMLGLLDSTFMLYTSDHGYHLGQFGLIKGKSMPYDFDIRVPYFIRGPECPQGVKIRNIALNIDIAPTILDMAGILVPDFMDGKSVLPLLRKEYEGSIGLPISKVQWRQTALIERGLRPNLIKLRERLMKQKELFSKEMRIHRECEQEKYRSPCKKEQRWECRKNMVGRWRIFKCRFNNTDHEKSINMCSCKKLKKKRRNARNRRSLEDKTEIFPIENPQNETESDYIIMEAVPEETMEKWADEFLTYVYQKKIVDSGWYQGRFEAVENFEDNEDWIDSMEDVEKNKTSLQRMKRENHINSRMLRRHKRRDSLNWMRRCLMKNKTISTINFSLHGHCRRRFANFEDWQSEMEKVDWKIKHLREKLDGMISIRRQLKGNKPRKIDSFGKSKENIEPDCDCDRESHPLRSEPPLFDDLDLSYAGLMALAEKNRNLRLNSTNSIFTNKKLGKRRKKPRSKDLNEMKKLCNVPNLNCFTHDNNHWKTPPFWTWGPFCFCQNSNNNTYWCLRTLNDTQDFLYCEFVTGFVSFYDMTKDRHQLHNIVYTLSYPILEQLSLQLDKLRKCKGAKECGRYENIG